MSEKRAGGILVSSFVAGLLLAAAIFSPRAWDPVPDDCYQSCLHCGVLDKHEHVEPIADFLKTIKPMPAKVPMTMFSDAISFIIFSLYTSAATPVSSSSKTTLPQPVAGPR